MKLQFGKVLGTTYDADSFIGVQPGVYGSKGVTPFELSHTYGFVSRPIDPDPDGTACQLFYAFDNSEGFAWLANDPRVQAKLPEVRPGESFMYGSTGAFVRIGADGVISLFTTHDRTTNGRSVFLQVAPTGLTFVSPYGKLTFDANGFHVLHSSGARFDLGAISAPAPLDALSSYATLSAAMVHVEGSAVHVGTKEGAPQQVALATATLALAGALNGVLTAIGTPGGIVAPPGGGPCTAGPALVSALATANAALATAQTALPSVSSTATGV